MCSRGFQGPHRVTVHHRLQSPDLWSRWTKPHTREQSPVRVPLLQTRLSWAFYRNGVVGVWPLHRAPFSQRDVSRFTVSQQRRPLLLWVSEPEGRSASHLLVSVVSSRVGALGWLVFTGRGERRLCEQCRPVRGRGAVHEIRSALVVGETAVSCALRSWTCPRSGCSGDWGSPLAGTGEFRCCCFAPPATSGSFNLCRHFRRRGAWVASLSPHFRFPQSKRSS